MKTTLLTVASLVALTFATPVFAQQTQRQMLDLKPGDDMPAKEVTLKNANGKVVALGKAYKENGLIVMFSCNTCPFVVKNQPVTAKVIKYAEEHNIGMVIINSNEAQRKAEDSYDAMKDYAKAQNYTVPYLVDDQSQVADLFGASHTPEVFLFNSNMKLVYKGAMNDNPGDPSAATKMYLKNAIDNMVAGQPVNPNATKSIGCGIKRNL